VHQFAEQSDRWTIGRDEQRAILDHCRRHGIWILADDAYERLYYGGGAAPSFLDISDANDRLVSANTFSKSWLMTGWRLGWIVAPAELMPYLGTLTEYNTSCAPSFVQRAGVVAIEKGEPVIARTQLRFRKARDFLAARLAEIPGVEAPLPAGAMYTFFKVQGVTDSLAYCKRLVEECGLGSRPYRLRPGRRRLPPLVLRLRRRPSGARRRPPEKGDSTSLTYLNLTTKTRRSRRGHEERQGQERLVFFDSGTAAMYRTFRQSRSHPFHRTSTFVLLRDPFVSFVSSW